MHFDDRVQPSNRACNTGSNPQREVHASVQWNIAGFYEQRDEYSSGRAIKHRVLESPTCGLRNSDSPTSDNRTPQETTNQGTTEVAEDGARLSCPGSSEIGD